MSAAGAAVGTGVCNSSAAQPSALSIRSGASAEQQLLARSRQVSAMDGRHVWPCSLLHEQGTHVGSIRRHYTQSSMQQQSQFPLRLCVQGTLHTWPVQRHGVRRGCRLQDA